MHRLIFYAIEIIVIYIAMVSPLPFHTLRRYLYNDHASLFNQVYASFYSGRELSTTDSRYPKPNLDTIF